MSYKARSGGEGDSFDSSFNVLNDKWQIQPSSAHETSFLISFILFNHIISKADLIFWQI
jgi:hypothetical protein